MGIIQIHGHSIHPHFLTKESVVLDLGANHGEFSKQVADRFGCVCIAVEGNSTLANSLQDPRLRVLHALVGDSDGTATLSVAENDQCSSLLEPLGSKVVRREEVRMVSLLSLFSELNLEGVDVLKMDIEGAEIRTLDACPDSILRNVGQLALEFHDCVGMTSLEEIERISRRLENLGFHWFRGTFSNYEDNLFINHALCPLGPGEMWYNSNIVRYWNGIVRLAKRRWPNRAGTSIL